MKVQHTGADALEVPAIGEIVEPGQPVDVPEEIGKQLLEQGWERSRSSAKSDKLDEKEKH